MPGSMYLNIDSDETDRYFKNNLEWVDHQLRTFEKADPSYKRGNYPKSTRMTKKQKDAARKRREARNARLHEKRAWM